MTKYELEVALKAANLWSGRSTLMLAVGILGEYALLPFLEKSRWHRYIKAFFAVLVVAGIVGEYQCSSQIAQNAAALQEIADQELGKATSDAGAAIERAATLEAENLKLRRLLQPRSMTAEQLHDIGKSLRHFAGYGIEVWSVTYDPESYFLSEQIAVTLKHAGFIVSDRSGDGVGATKGGTGLRITHSTARRDVAESIRGALIKIGGMDRKDVLVVAGRSMICCTNGVSVEDPRPFLTIWVGSKPLPKFE